MHTGHLVNYFYKTLPITFAALIAEDSFAQLQIESSWIALAPPAATANAAYMEIYNPLAQSQNIIDVSADCCALVMLHQMRKEGDKMMMEHLDELLIPAKSKVMLKPGSLHLMLMKSAQELQLDSQVKITFTFDSGKKQNVLVGVKKYEHE